MITNHCLSLDLDFWATSLHSEDHLKSIQTAADRQGSPPIWGDRDLTPCAWIAFNAKKLNSNPVGERNLMFGTATHPPLCVVCAIMLMQIMGCVNSIRDTIPAHSVPSELRGPSREQLGEFDFTLLGQTAPREHIIGPGDILGIDIPGIMGNSEEVESEVHYPSRFSDTRSGNFVSPAVGSPISVLEDGTISLPYIESLSIAGLTLTKASEKIREAFVTGTQLIQPGRDAIKVTLIKPRSIQVIVLREDSINKWPIFKQNNSTLAVKRGSAHAIDLSIYQNDVLHALTESGGLPGSDAGNEIWVLHNDVQEQSKAEASNDDDAMNAGGPVLFTTRSHIVKISLAIQPGQALNFTTSDVILESGDVVFVPPRSHEHFFVGGALRGQQVYLPRDYELDVIEAIAMAGGQTDGPPGAAIFTSPKPGAVLPPTRVLILRKVPGGDQITIHVNLKKALDDQNERIPICSGDVIILQYTPGEIVGNYLANLTKFNVRFSRGYLTHGNPAVKFANK